MDVMNTLLDFQIFTIKGKLCSNIIKTSNGDYINYYIERTDEDEYMAVRHDIHNGVSVKRLEAMPSIADAIYSANKDLIELIRKRFYNTDLGVELEIYFMMKSGIDLIISNTFSEDDSMRPTLDTFYYEDILKDVQKIILKEISPESLFTKLSSKRKSKFIPKLKEQLKDKLIAAAILEGNQDIISLLVRMIGSL